ncbi:hypothetical protein niasHT_008677 [Heterodera trifolii]|uniref:Uncharacterized protein n=1 Tax=Heterodera trifolii TaxID=157864 RepID=A0ABD2M8Y5_9BILA
MGNNNTVGEHLIEEENDVEQARVRGGGENEQNALKKAGMIVIKKIWGERICLLLTTIAVIFNFQFKEWVVSYDPEPWEDCVHKLEIYWATQPKEFSVNALSAIATIDEQVWIVGQIADFIQWRQRLHSSFASLPHFYSLYLLELKGALKKRLVELKLIRPNIEAVFDRIKVFSLCWTGLTPKFGLKLEGTEDRYLPAYALKDRNLKKFFCQERPETTEKTVNFWCGIEALPTVKKNDEQPPEKPMPVQMPLAADFAGGFGGTRFKVNKREVIRGNVEIEDNPSGEQIQAGPMGNVGLFEGRSTREQKDEEQKGSGGYHKTAFTLSTRKMEQKRGPKLSQWREAQKQSEKEAKQARLYERLRMRKEKELKKEMLKKLREETKKARVEIHGGETVVGIFFTKNSLTESESPRSPSPTDRLSPSYAATHMMARGVSF